jgi:hypothetical protein
MTTQRKRGISFCLFGLGIAAGVAGCVASPIAIFTIGENDSTPEIWALLLPLTLLPTCIVALWWRKAGSLWLLTLGLIWTYGMAWQRHYMLTVRHFPAEPLWQLFGGGLLPCYFVLGLGLFGLFTERAQWPKMLGSRTSSVSAE